MSKWLICLMLALMPYCAFAEDKPAAAVSGTVQLAEGTVTVQAGAGAPHALHVGDPVREGDLVATGKDSELELEMADHAYLALRANSSLRITSYQAEDGDDDHAVLELFKGAMRTITGLIGKRNKDRFSLRTPDATIGIRGTDHEILLIVDATHEAEAGTYEHVIAGGIVLRNQQGEVEISAGQAAFAPSQGGKAPRVLARVPGFMPKGKHENRLDGRQDDIQKFLRNALDKRDPADLAGDANGSGKADRSDPSSKRDIARNRLRRTR